MPDADAASRSTILIRNGYVIPGAHRAHLDRADIFIDQDRIAAVGPDLLEQPIIATSNPRIVEATKRIVIPGFINAHTHSNESFSQGFWDALPLEVWLLHTGRSHQSVVGNRSLRRFSCSLPRYRPARRYHDLDVGPPVPRAAAVA